MSGPGSEETRPLIHADCSHTSSSKYSAIGENALLCGDHSNTPTGTKKKYTWENPTLSNKHNQNQNGTELKPRAGAKLLDGVQLRVYLSHSMAAWADRMWMFAISVFLIELAPEDLRLTASYGLVISISIILFGEVIGRWIDRTQRLTAARTSIIVHSLSVIACCIFICIIFFYVEEDRKVMGSDVLTAGLYAAVIITADVASLAMTAIKIALEKDWIVVIAGDDTKRLSNMNSIFQSIDLTTLVAAPILVGQLISNFESSVAAVFICVWNLVSAFIQYFLLWKIFKDLPELGRKKPAQCGPKKSRLKEYLTGWSRYFSNEVRWVGFALASIYMTVLGFDNITVGYAYSQGISEALVGGAMALGSAVGIVGALVYPFLARKTNLWWAGFMGFLAQIAALSSCVVAICLPGSPWTPYLEVTSDSQVVHNDSMNITTVPTRTTLLNSSVEATHLFSSGNSTVADITGNTLDYTSIIVMMSGIIAARFGLYIIDLSITQIMQEKVEEHERGRINGVQFSLNQMMEMIKFTLVVVVPKPKDFGYLTISSYIFIILGFLSFLVGR